MTNSDHVHHSDIWAPARFNYFLEEWRDQQSCRECLAFQSDAHQQLRAGLGLSLRSLLSQQVALQAAEMCLRRWRSLLSSSLREREHHIPIRFINVLCGPHELLLGFTGGHGELQPFPSPFSPPAPLISSWWTTKAQGNGIFALWLVLGSMPQAKLWGTLSWHLKLAPNTRWSRQSWQPWHGRLLVVFPGKWFRPCLGSSVLVPLPASSLGWTQDGMSWAIVPCFQWDAAGDVGRGYPRAWGETWAPPCGRSRWGLTRIYSCGSGRECGFDWDCTGKKKESCL